MNTVVSNSCNMQKILEQFFIIPIPLAKSGFPVTAKKEMSNDEKTFDCKSRQPLAFYFSLLKRTFMKEPHQEAGSVGAIDCLQMASSNGIEPVVVLIIFI